LTSSTATRSTTTRTAWRRLFAVAGVLVVLGAGCSALDEPGVEAEATPAFVGAAASRTAEAGSSAFTAVLTYDVVPADHPETAFINGIEVEVSGRFDSETGRVAASLDPDSRQGIGAGVVGEISTITDPETDSLYVQEEDGPWVRWDLSALPPEPGGVLAASVRMTRLLEVVGRAQGDVVADGQAFVAGVDTALLRTRVVLGEVIQGEEDTAALRIVTGQGDLTPILETDVPVELYVGGDGLVHRMVVTFDLKPVLVAAGFTVSTATERVQLDLDEIGSAGSIELPAESVEAGA
jgi:hypothetical protein